VTDTLTDRIEAHLAKARAAVPARQHEKRGWWCCGINGGFVVSAPEGDHMTTIARGGSEPVGRHIAANNPATIEAFCAVAKADEVLAEEARLHIACGRNEKFSRACRELACYPLCRALAASSKTRAALYDALGRSK